MEVRSRVYPLSVGNFPGHTRFGANDVIATPLLNRAADGLRLSESDFGKVTAYDRSVWLNVRIVQVAIGSCVQLTGEQQGQPKEHMARDLPFMKHD